MSTLPVFPSYIPTSNAKAGPSQRRQLMGAPRAGSGLAVDDGELSEEEDQAAHDKREEASFGYRFLMPIGRRQTAMEYAMDGRGTPSEPDHERRQEDHNDGSETPPLADLDVQTSTEDDEGVVDLDQSVEDMDADAEHASDATELDEDPPEGEVSMEEES